MAQPSPLDSRKTWMLFLVFLLSNSVLSYFPFSLQAKLWIGLLGLGLPFYMAWRSAFLTRHKALDQWEFLPRLPLWGWGLLGLLALAARFSGLTTLFVWPNFDESSYGFDAFQLAGPVPPRLFYGVSQAPPLYVWGLGFFFKLFGSSLTTLWFFPALVSLTAVPLAYLAARTLFSRSFSVLFAFLMAASFWPVFVGRFSLMTILILPMECLALYFLGRFLGAVTAPGRAKAAWGLGVTWGLGFYTHLHWPVVLALTAPPFAVWLWKNRGGRKAQSLPLALRALGSAGVLALPLFIGAYRQHYGGYLSHLWAFNSSFSWQRQISVWASCLTSPFWGMDISVHTYQPEWGGFLNPFLSSLFFLGLLRMVGQLHNPFHRWLLAGLVLCLLPGLLTQDMETFRLFPMVPLLILGCLWGLETLLEASKPWRNLALLCALLLPSMVLDSLHLFGFYHGIWKDPASWGYYTKSVGRYRAYGYLEQWREKAGPGLVFQDFVQGLPDQSLAVATYDYNAALNPRLSLGDAHWAAVLANVNYRPFLISRFPDGTAYALSRDFAESDGGWMLFVFPLDEDRRKQMEPWCAAQKALEPFVDVNLCYVMGHPFDRDLESLAALEPSFRGDPFLRSAFFEKKADLESKQALLDTPGGASPSPESLKAASQDLEKAVAQGYPAAHLYEHLGILGLMGQDLPGSRKFFERARRCPLNLTDAAQQLAALRPAAKRAP